MTYQEAIQQASVNVLRRDAEVLLQHVSGQSRAWLLAHPEAHLPSHEADRFFALVARRAIHEPLQYLTQRQEFYGLELRLTPDVLIPRPETELLVEAVLHWAGEQASVPTLQLVDVGTGSGAIALALATHLPFAEIVALDLSGAALHVASGNAERLGLAGRVRFEQSDLLSAFLAKAGAAPLDAVVSNPPYVPVDDAPGMQPEVRDHEPHLALFAGRDGLDIYRRLIPEAKAALRPGGLLAMEFGFGQREALATLVEGWRAVRFLQDYAGIPRIALAERP